MPQGTEQPVIAQWITDVFERYMFHCPGCGHSHWVQTKLKNASGGPLWEWNGSVTKPTFKPSLLVTYDGPDAGKHGSPPACCHSYVTDGMIQFLPDSTHSLAGQTVPIRPIDN